MTAQLPVGGLHRPHDLEHLLARLFRREAPARAAFAHALALHKRSASGNLKLALRCQAPPGVHAPDVHGPATWTIFYMALRNVSEAHSRAG